MLLKQKGYLFEWSNDVTTLLFDNVEAGNQASFIFLRWDQQFRNVIRVSHIICGRKMGYLLIRVYFTNKPDK